MQKPYDHTTCNTRGDTEAGSERQEDRGVREDNQGQRTDAKAGEEAVQGPDNGSVQRSVPGTEVQVTCKWDRL